MKTNRENNLENVKTQPTESLAKPHKFSKSRASLAVLFGLGTYLIGCSDNTSNPVNPDCKTQSPIVPPAGDTVYAYFTHVPVITEKTFSRPRLDLCNDVQISMPRYNAGAIAGIDNIIFSDITQDHCGYLGPGITGMEKVYQVTQINGTADAIAKWNKLIDAKVIDRVFLKKDGKDASIYLNESNTATSVEIHLDVTGTGNGGIDSLFTNGILAQDAYAYGQHGSLAQSRDFSINIVNPSIIQEPYTQMAMHDSITGVTWVTKDRFNQILDSLHLPTLPKPRI